MEKVINLSFSCDVFMFEVISVSELDGLLGKLRRVMENSI